MARSYTFVVGPTEVHLRLDRYLLRHLPQTVSRAMVQRAIRAGAVTIEGKRAKAHRRLKPGQRVNAEVEGMAPPPSPLARPEPMALDIVYEDEQVLVVNKPPGLVTHPAPGHWTGTLLNALLWHLKHRQETADKRQETDKEEGRLPGPGYRQPATGAGRSDLPRAGIVHRLDKDTSGLLLVAKTATALAALTKQLKARAIRRGYLALVEGLMELEEGTVTAAIGRHLRHRKQMAVRYVGGRQAVTHYRVLKRLSGRHGLSPMAPLAYTVLDVQLETGRTHQIRVHMAQLGHPVLGDSMYSHHPAGYWAQAGIARQLLHAYRLQFLHPTRQKSIALTAPIPYDMQQWVGEGLRHRDNKEPGIPP